MAGDILEVDELRDQRVREDPVTAASPDVSKPCRVRGEERSVKSP